MSVTRSQNIGNSIVCVTACSNQHQRNDQNAHFYPLWEIHWSPWGSPHKGPSTAGSASMSWRLMWWVFDLRWPPYELYTHQDMTSVCLGNLIMYLFIAITCLPDFTIKIVCCASGEPQYNDWSAHRCGLNIASCVVCLRQQLIWDTQPRNSRYGNMYSPIQLVYKHTIWWLH